METWFLNDTDWFAAFSALLVAGVYAVIVPRSRPACFFIMLLAGGWWAGYIILTCMLGLHMTPPRSDNWSGCVGLFVAIVFYLIRQKNRAALNVTLFGFLSGGIGFAVGDLFNSILRTCDILDYRRDLFPDSPGIIRQTKTSARSTDSRLRSILETQHATLDKLAAGSRPHHPVGVSYRILT